ncbi:MAG: YncE family protein [Candidatus Korobacteraceae bacterium]
MHTSRHTLFLVLAVSLLAGALPAVAQVVIATVPAGTKPSGVAVDAVTNNAYVANECGGDPTCSSPGTVTVINGATNGTTTVTVGDSPVAVAVNPTTNTIYVANLCGNDLTCSSAGTVTVINGASNTVTATITVGYGPDAIAVNATTNMIYVANYCGNDVNCLSPGTVTAINGATNNIATVTVGDYPEDLAVNSTTNKIYVANLCGNDITCSSVGTTTVINGNNNSTVAVAVGFDPYYLDLDATTNEIYVSNNCGNDVTCRSPGTVTAINGVTNSAATVVVGDSPGGIAVNAATNQIYVANECGNDSTCGSPGTVTVIDGASNNTTTVGVGVSPLFVAVNATTNQIYVPNFCGTAVACNTAGTVSVIDGATNSVLPIAVGDGPSELAVNLSTNTAYVANVSDGTVSVIGGSTKLELINVTPCRLVDTRQAMGTFGGPAITGGTSRSFPLPQNTNCNIPSSAAAYSLNVTVVPITTLGYLTIWPTPEMQPVVSTLNSPDGRIKANAAIVPAGVSGAVSVYVSDTTNVILDIDAYFAPAASNSYQFYPLTPCRIVDTRNNQDQGMLRAGVERDYSIPGNCAVPSNATAYSFNVTVLPSPGGLDYLTVWPKGEPQPLVSTLNDNTGTVVANAAIVPAGSENATAFYAHSNSTNLLVDVDGYFAAPGTGGLSMYPAVPCRVLDTRQSGNGFTGQIVVNVEGSVCAPPGSASGYIFNATVVPPGSMPYLTLWPDGEQQPVVSTLNAYDGFITSNMAIVPTNNGSIDAFAYALTQLILDISGYFAP